MTTYNIPEHLIGLSAQELNSSRAQYGFNQVAPAERSTWYTMVLDILKEPMLILLIAVAVIYVIVGNYSESLFMLGAIIAVAGSSFYRDHCSKKAAEALGSVNKPVRKRSR